MVDFAVFTATYAAQHAAIEGDPEISDVHRAEFRQHIEACRDASLLYDHAADFCHSRQLSGRAVALSTGERLGRAHKRLEFVRLIANSLGLSHRDVEDLLQDWLGLGPSDQLTEVHTNIGHLLMSAHIIWAFRNETSAAKPLTGVNIPDLPCALGLQYTATTMFLFWEFEPPSGVGPHMSTAFDAGMRYMPGWKPGGKTLPNAECRDRYTEGMPEVVLQPVHFSALTGHLRWTP